MSIQTDIVRRHVEALKRRQDQVVFHALIQHVEKLCDDFDKLSELSEKIDEAKIEISNAIRELKDTIELNVIRPARSNRSPIWDSIKIATLGDPKENERLSMKEARELNVIRPIKRRIVHDSAYLLAEDPEAKP